MMNTILKKDISENDKSLFIFSDPSIFIKPVISTLLNPEIVALNIINTLKNSNSLNGKFIDLNKNELAW